jgi:hypothetical protein
LIFFGLFHNDYYKGKKIVIFAAITRKADKFLAIYDFKQSPTDGFEVLGLRFGVCDGRA